MFQHLAPTELERNSPTAGYKHPAPTELWKRALSLDRHADQHLAPLVRAAVDPDAPAHLFRALAHADQPEVAVRAVRRNLLVEPAPVVPDAQPHIPRIEVEVNADRPRLRVADGVVDGLLHDAQEVILDLRGERAERAADLKLRLDAAL